MCTARSRTSGENLVDFLTAPFSKKLEPPHIPGRFVIEVAEAPTGLMCIKRQVLSKMMAQYPNLRYVPDGSWTPERAALCYRFFDVMVDEKTGRYLSEDYAFCRRWRDMGGRVHVCTQAVHCDLLMGQRNASRTKTQ
jgi:hypothetical protein